MDQDDQPTDQAADRSPATPSSATAGALLAAAVNSIGGVPREGQQVMADAVETALGSGRHLLVQAGTGTGKSLGYLVPGTAHAVRGKLPVVISTATLALQAQIVDRDLPRLAQALAPLLGRRPTWQLVKGRRNYLCRYKLEGGFPEEDTLFDTLYDPPEPAPDAVERAVGHPAPVPAPARYGGGTSSRLGREVVRLREWAESTKTGDRDELVPGVSEKAWRQVSVSAHECLGSRCPAVAECHVELARERARHVDVVVTNHAFVAIDSFEGRQMLPEHDVLILDEAHEFADRVTAVITDELTPTGIEAAGRSARRIGVGDTGMLDVAGETLEGVLAGLPSGRLEQGLPEALQASIDSIRDAARVVISSIQQLGPDKSGDVEGARQVARASVTEVFDVAERLADDAGRPGGRDVVWVSRTKRLDGSERVGLHVAPLTVAGLLRDKLFGERTVVLTSATLALGGSFDSAAGSVGLLGDGDAPEWQGLDVGSPFDYPRQGILYLAKHLPAPGREGTSAQALDELADLITAAGGRTLGLFSSRRAAEAAAEAMRERLDVPILCQGDDATPTLVRQFAKDARTCLFGTLSLWQGVDVPGPACQLVVVDRIPFPRPDDPLASARQRAVAQAGGNGFMSVAAVHAALRLAQGVGRLVRTSDDKGVVAVLDSRLATARYGGFLRTSLPPFWTTTDRSVVLEALRRIDATAGAVRPVDDAAVRAIT